MTTTTDRYVTFKGIDCEGNSKRLMEMLRRHLADPQKSNPFWDKFLDRLAQVGRPQQNGGRSLDELFLIHTYINNLYEFFEEVEDDTALELLGQIERECC